MAARYGSKSERDKEAAAKNRLANVSENWPSTRKAANAAVQETNAIVTREMIDAEAKRVAARQEIDRARTASRAANITGSQANHTVTKVDRKTGKANK